MNTDDKTDDIHGDNGWMLDTKNYKTTAHKGKEKTWTTGKKATTLIKG